MKRFTIYPPESDASRIERLAQFLHQLDPEIPLEVARAIADTPSNCSRILLNGEDIPIKE